MAWDGVERRTTTPDLQEQVKGLRESVGALSGAVAEAFPADKMQQVLDDALEQERVSRRRFALGIAIPLIAVAGLGIATLKVSEDARSSAEDAHRVAEYVDDCLIVPAAERDAERCGSSSDTGRLVQSLVQYWNCALLIVPADRTEEQLNDCARQAFGS